MKSNKLNNIYSKLHNHISTKRQLYEQNSQLHTQKQRLYYSTLIATSIIQAICQLVTLVVIIFIILYNQRQLDYIIEIALIIEIITSMFGYTVKQLYEIYNLRPKNQTESLAHAILIGDVDTTSEQAGSILCKLLLLVIIAMTLPTTIVALITYVMIILPYLFIFGKLSSEYTALNADVQHYDIKLERQNDDY